jgi:hypothetical protein
MKFSKLKRGISIFLFLVLTIILVLVSIAQEQKLIKTFENNDLLWDENKITSLSDEYIDTLNLTLLNLGFLPSHKGKYNSILFKNKFQLKRYTEFDILTLNTFVSSYSIKLPKSASSIKNDIFAGCNLI